MLNAHQVSAGLIQTSRFVAIIIPGSTYVTCETRKLINFNFLHSSIHDLKDVNFLAFSQMIHWLHTESASPPRYHSLVGFTAFMLTQIQF